MPTPMSVRGASAIPAAASAPLRAASAPLRAASAPASAAPMQANPANISGGGGDIAAQLSKGLNDTFGAGSSPQDVSDIVDAIGAAAAPPDEKPAAPAKTQTVDSTPMFKAALPHITRLADQARIPAREREGLFAAWRQASAQSSAAPGEALQQMLSDSGILGRAQGNLPPLRFGVAPAAGAAGNANRATFDAAATVEQTRNYFLAKHGGDARAMERDPAYRKEALRISQWLTFESARTGPWSQPAAAYRGEGLRSRATTAQSVPDLPLSPVQRQVRQSSMVEAAIGRRRPEHELAPSINEPRDDLGHQPAPAGQWLASSGAAAWGVGVEAITGKAKPVVDYDASVTQIVTDFSSSIKRRASVLGARPTAMAAALAEEAQKGNGLKDDMSSAAQWGLSQFDHEFIAARFEDYEAALRANPEAVANDNPQDVFSLAWQKFFKPVTLDLGPAKIKAHTAIRLVREYEAIYGHSSQDPLGLKKYANDYASLVQDLVDGNQETTTALIGLMVKEAADWFATKAPHVWKVLSEDDKDALIVDYYNLGREKIKQRYDEDIRERGAYAPHVGESGFKHQQNAARVNQALNGLGR